MSTFDAGILVRFARFYAATKHDGQSYSGLPYTHHLQKVAEVVVEFFDLRDGTFLHGFGDLLARGCVLPGEYLSVLVAAAWLHDVCEDQGVKRKEIEEQFGPAVAELVWRVTNEEGANRKIRHALTYPKIREMKLAVFLKLCDRIANVRQGGPLLTMYQKEYEDFRRALYTPGEFERAWKELDDLLEPAAL